MLPSALAGAELAAAEAYLAGHARPIDLARYRHAQGSGSGDDWPTAQRECVGALTALNLETLAAYGLVAQAVR